MQTQGALDHALVLANQALSTAEGAHEMAVQAGTNVGEIKLEAEVLQKNASNLHNEAVLMGDRVENTEAEFVKLQAQSNKNASLLEEAKEKVSSSF